MTHAKPDAPVLRLTNTLTRSKEVFAPIDAANVRMYVCGPTVYDFAHIGNARPVIVFDVLFRLLRQTYGADHVTYVRNITDVDDKINARALRDHPGLPLNDAIALVTKTTADQFHKDVATLGNLEPTHEPRATQHIAGMVSMIETLIARGHAYVAATEEGGEVLFDTGSMPTYGQLSKRNLDDQLAGARIAVDAHKKNPGDFVLWKLSSPEEPGWDSPWGRGRPGWHIECSVMSKAHLGEVFDIHGGGLDLIFPHHENEIAQSCCAHGTSVMANYWMHNGFVQVEGRKMSKSDGNFFTIHDLLHTEVFGGRKWPGEVLRLAMLMTNYREPIDFSVRKLEEAENILTRWYRMLDQAGDVAPSTVSSDLIAALADDLDTGAAVKVLQGLFSSSRLGDLVLSESTLGWDFYQPESAAISLASAQFLGLMQQKPETWLRGGDQSEQQAIEALVAERLAFLEAKNFAEADRLRDELTAMGVLLKDGKDPATGQRTTTWEVKR
ncbi:cysteine--tRNA ligase [Pannonibacter sp.]|uniref:cysteine--tRNA ligase n=1 Tax=Pannonibacter sp. TaxID=1906786 RepID=UPI003F72DA43